MLLMLLLLLFNPKLPIVPDKISLGVGDNNVLDDDLLELDIVILLLELLLLKDDNAES